MAKMKKSLTGQNMIESVPRRLDRVQDSTPSMHPQVGTMPKSVIGGKGAK